jgi:hypothetical protein
LQAVEVVVRVALVRQVETLLAVQAVLVLVHLLLDHPLLTAVAVVGQDKMLVALVGQAAAVRVMLTAQLTQAVVVVVVVRWAVQVSSFFQYRLFFIPAQQLVRPR